MYKKLPPILYQNKHTSGWDIPGYGYEGVLLFTSPAKAKAYTNTDAAEHGFEVIIAPENAFEKMDTAALPEMLNRLTMETDPAGNEKVIIINLNNKKGYDAIYKAGELLQLLNGDEPFCSAYGNYQKDQFKGLLSLYGFQDELTGRLDETAGLEFTQDIINEIVLWKVNRYVSTKQENNWLKLLNDFKNDKYLDEEKLTAFLRIVIPNVHGIRLPMASTMLRFRNPQIFQIIDERMYRVIMRQADSPKLLISITQLDQQISLYITYLKKLNEFCSQVDIPFCDSDRILYQFDIIKNGDFN